MLQLLLANRNEKCAVYRLNIHISQGSAANLRLGGRYNSRFLRSSLLYTTVKEFTQFGLHCENESCTV